MESRPVLLASEIVKENILRRHSKTVKQFDYRLCHHRRTAHQIDYVLRVLVVLEISLIKNIVDKACSICNSCCISLRIRTVKCKIELEVREVFLDLVIVFKVECLFQAACSIEEVDFP